MQRSLSYPFFVSALFYLGLFFVYESLSTIYLFMPPLLGVLLFYFLQAIKKEDLSLLFLIMLMLLIFEANYGYLFFSTMVYFAFVYKFVTPRLEQYMQCRLCILAFNTLLAYVGFYAFSLLLSQVLWMGAPAINGYLLWYIIAEFFMVILL